MTLKVLPGWTTYKDRLDSSVFHIFDFLIPGIILFAFVGLGGTKDLTNLDLWLGATL